MSWSVAKAAERDGGGTGTLWYFGFGSNMVLSVMEKRGLQILDIKTVTVPGFVLTFDVFGLPYSEPASASIAKYKVGIQGEASIRPPDVCGVAYLLSVRDFHRLVATEGGGVAYKEIKLSGTLIDSDAESIAMHTLMAIFPRRPNAAPSARYLNLLIQGAKDNDLPNSYQIYLRSLPCWDAPTTYWERLDARTFLFFGRRIVKRLANWVKAATNDQGICPSWYQSLIYYVYGFFWVSHDWVFAPIFGRGDGGGMSYGSLILIN